MTAKNLAKKKSTWPDAYFLTINSSGEFMPTIRIPTPLRPYAGNTPEVSVAGDTVGAALNDLTVQHPDLRKHLYTEAGEVRAFVNLFLAQEDVPHLPGEKTPPKETSPLRVLPLVAGGVKSTPPRTRDHTP